MTTPKIDHPTAAPEPYSQQAPCPKCGSLAVTTEMCTQTADPSMWGLLMGQSAACWWSAWLLPHIHRDCRNCGWVFYQRPLDAKPDDYTPVRLAERKAERERRQKERQRLREEAEQKAAEDRAARAAEAAPTEAETRSHRPFWRFR